MKIRVAKPSDAEGILEIYAPAIRDNVISFELEVPTVEEFGRRIETTLSLHPWLVAEDDAGIAGYAYASQHRARLAYQWSVDVSVYVAPERHRSGLARKLYGALFQILRRQNVFNAYAGITIPNPASIGLHESLGFELVGVYRKVGYKHGAWHDVGWWGLELQPHASEPAIPTPFSRFSDGEISTLLKGFE